MQTDLLYEDFSDLVVPYRQDPEAYELSTVGAHYYQVNESLTVSNHWHGLDGFLRAVACGLLTNHGVWLEVTFENENRDDAPFAVFEVHNVSRTETGDLIQKLPRREELPNSFLAGDEWEPEVELDASRMIHAVLPETYSSQLLMQVVRDLAEIEPNVTPTWIEEQWSGQRQDAPPFDVQEAIRTERLRITQAALPIGWTAREVFLGPNCQVSEYYHFRRELRFLHLRSSMRARAEDALREVLTLAGERCGFSAYVTARGVHTPCEAQRFVREFEDGELAFSALSDIIVEKFNDAWSQQRRVV